MIEFYNFLKSTCSQKVRMCLHTKGLDFVERPVNLSLGEHLAPDYLALNPNGVVPTIRHDGQVVTDSSVIMEYLDEVFDTPRLSGRTPLERAEVRTWLRFFEEVPTVAIRIPSFKHVLLKPVEKMTPDERGANSDKRTLRRSFYQSMEDGIDEARLAEAMERLDMTIDRMERALASRRWVAGDDFSIADIAVIPTFDRMRDLGYGDRWSDRPGVSRWWSQVTRLDAFDKTYPPGSRLSDGMAVTAD
ncbi:glutathione S-transferase family protein [Maritimibacter sp. UBA3975]|uniref:glutathione S-transferase family protein n=1 Tax=Maritimibacter sp. UBA3975 TaxID=1946833 RepID=UPI000C0A9B10|nr:glutathione S-transferase family protein [Maritimibacter sp. UBA3975]MAM61409.1 glutathione S-transferase [Maritimibacter sp.]